MGKIKKILENELIGGTQNTDVYPVTSTKAVYDENNENLDSILKRRGIINVSTNYNSTHIAETLTLEQAIDKVPLRDRVLGFTMTFLSSDGWKNYQFTGTTIDNWTDVNNWTSFVNDVQLKSNQDSITEKLDTKVNTSDIVQETGDSTTSVMSQKAVTDAIQAEIDRATAAEQAIIYDVSSHNNGAVFESLSALLSSSNLSTLIPTSVWRGGMSIRFIQDSEFNSDNKYVQYRLTTTSFSTNESDWQGVDDGPTVGSNNIVKSGGVANKLAELDRKIGFIELPITSSNRYIATNFAEGTVIDIHNPTASGDYRYILAECEEGDLLKITGEGGSSPRLWAFIDSDYRIVSVDKVANHVAVNLLLEAPKNAKYIIINDKVKDGDNSPSFIAKKDSLYVTKAEKEVVDNLLSSYNENVGVLLKNKTINITAGINNYILQHIYVDVDNVTLVIKELVEYESIVITGAVIQKDGTVRYPAKRVYNNSIYQFELGSNVESFSLYIASSGATNNGSITLDVLIGLSKELKDLDEKIDNVSADLLKNISRIDKTDSAYILFSNPTISQADFAENNIIKLTANTKLTENINLPNNVKIDFNGHYISLNGYTIEGSLANEYISPENFNIPSTINPSSTVLSKFLELNICNFKFFNDITLNQSIIEIKTHKDIDFNNITINYTNTAPASYNTGIIRLMPVGYNTHQKIKNLQINANYLYDYGFVYFYGARQLILENIKVKNVLKRAFVFGMTTPTGGYKGNIIAYNLDCWNDRIEGSPSDTIGYYINVGDSIFYNCVSVYFGVGFSIHSITTLINPHPWGSPYDGENDQPYFDIIWSQKLDMICPQIDGRRYPIRFSVTDNHSRPYIKISNGIWYDNNDENNSLEHKLISVDGGNSLIKYNLANVSMFTMIDGIKICDEDLSQYVKADIDYSPETN